MNKLILKNFIKVVCLVVFQNTVAQTQDGFKAPDFTPKSPEAAAFLKYGEYPVDLSTGVPSISLPIYTIKVDDVEIPISLNYHASGIKVNQEATWVGLGWNLTAGAQIILNAKDDVDENDPEIDNPQRDAFFVKQIMLNHPYAFSSSALNEYEKSKVKDVYSFSSSTVSGNFYIDNGVPVIFPPDAFKVEFSGQLNVMSFIITDKFGNKYLFKNTIEKSERVFTHHDDYISAWYVDEIITAKNNKIKFTYQDDGNVIEYSESESIGVIEEGKNCGCSIGSTKSETIGQIRKSNENTITSTKKIKEITFNDDQTKVEFELKKGRLDLVNKNGYLQSIKISQNGFDGFLAVKKVNFEYSYFNDDQTGSDAYKYKRLRLDRMYELNDSSEHSFIYSDIALPIKDSKAQDFYGYYNGQYNFSLIPKHILLSPSVRTVGTANREVNPLMIQAGILKEVHYPTKGSSHFNYEPNTFFGIDQLSKYSIQMQGASLNGIGPANNPAPGQLEDPDGESDYEGQNCNSDGDCLKYKTVHKQVFNPKSSYLTCRIRNSGSTSDPVIKYKYCRVFVYSNGLVFDSGRVNKDRDIKIPIMLSSGDCMIVVEAYGEYMGVSAQLDFSDEDTTPKNIPAAGLRIKHIESYDSDNTLLLKKTYEYNDKDNNARTSGQLINDLSADFISGSFANFTQAICQTEDNSVIPKVDYTKGYYINSRSKQGIEANTVIYKYVKEISVNLKEAENIFTEYEFTTDADWTRSDVGLQINFGWKRGKILEKKEFKTIGNNTFILRKEKNTYFEDNSKTANFKGYKLVRRSFIDVNENSSNPQQQPAILAILSDCQVPQGLSSSYVLADYNIPIPWFYQKSTEISNYFYNSSNSLTGTLVNTTNYNYSNPAHLQLTSQSTINSKKEILETKFLYAPDAEMAGKPFINELKLANMIGIPLDTQTFKAGTKTQEQLTTYDKSVSTNNLLLPKFVYSNKGLAAIDLNSDKKITYDQYDDKGNLLQYTLENGIPVSIIWGYDRTQPIAKLENVLYSAIPSQTISNLQTLSNSDNDNCISEDCREQQLRNALKLFSNSIPDAFISTYTYNPLVGVTSTTDIKGLTSYYEYDGVGRLRFIKDKDLNVLQKYCYNYKGQNVDCSDNTSTSVVMYKSAARSGSFTRSNCEAGGTGSSVSYSQNAGAVISTISQADADSLGLAKFNADGQAYANSNATCTYYSVAQSGSFTKNNCDSGGVGSSVLYSQDAGVISSIVSQANANALGLAKFNADGQSYANASGFCTYYSVAQSGSFTKNNCESGGIGSSNSYHQNAGIITSINSQAEADALGLSKFNIDGQAYANANGYCNYYSSAFSGSFTKNNCAVGGVGSSVAFSQVFGARISNVSQADADALGLAKFNSDGQAYANSNATCTFYSIAQSGSFTKNNCNSGGIGSSILYSQEAGVISSIVSQANADALGLAKFNSDGQAYANSNAFCTFYSAFKSGTFIRNNCGAGFTGSSVTYVIPSGKYNSTVSQPDADNKAQLDINTNGQNYANSNGSCTLLPPSFTYNELYDTSSRQMTINVYASSTNHNGATFNFKIYYEHVNLTNRTLLKSVVLAAGETHASLVFVLSALSYSTELLSLIKK